MTPEPTKEAASDSVKTTGRNEPLEMTEEDRIALNTDYKKGRVDRTEAEMYRHLLR